MSGDVYLCFKKAEKLNWLLRKILHPEISHVFVMIVDGDRVIVSDETQAESNIFTLSDVNDILSDIKFMVKTQQKDCNQGILCVNTCVGRAKKVIGLRDFRILTPYQLFKVVNHGAH